MPRIEKPTIQDTWKVEIWEYERGWGCRLDDTFYYDDEAEAKEYVKQYNAKNTAKVAPDIYWVAFTPTKVTI